MRAHSIPLLMFVLTSAVATAQEQKFPYDAEVVAAEAYVRSGPGTSSYATGKLSRGARVRVHRHDLGGWYMIAPPPGSFSWIRSEHVDPQAGGRGIVNANDVVVRMGSSLSDDFEAYQVTLSPGDEVKILGEKTIPTEQGAIRMYRIAPPRGEFRWIMGQDVQPVGGAYAAWQGRDPLTESAPLSRPQGQGIPSTSSTSQSGSRPFGDSGNLFDQSDPFSRPEQTIVRPAPPPKSVNQTEQTTHPDSNPPFVERPLVRTRDDEAVHRNVPLADELHADRQRLNDLNDRFRGLVEKDTKDWDLQQLETLEADYKRLRDHASQPTLESRVDLKLREIEHWREFKREFDDFVKLTAETTERDAKLLALQRQKEAGFDDTESDADDAPIGEPRTITSDAPPPSGSPPVPDGSQIVPPTSNPSPQPPPLPSETQSTSRIPRFDGAGIVQRAATVFPRFPRYVLLAPNGRILAYLEGQPGVNLDLYLGRAMGIIGVRTHRQELQADFISVRRLVPVRLKVAP